MLRLECEHGVKTVVLTPHYYRDRENPKQFLLRRDASVELLEGAIRALPELERNLLPSRILGAEVTWAPNLHDCEELPLMCIGQTKNLLLELPYAPWNDRMIDQIYDLMGRTGITPIIAHLERYVKLQRPEMIREVLALGVPVQISADVLLRVTTRKSAMKLLKSGQARILASDCHNCTDRPPNLAAGLEIVSRKLGEHFVKSLLACADELITA